MRRPELRAAEEYLEQRLEAALDARARSVGLGDLQPRSLPLSPSSPAVRRRFPARTAFLFAFGLAAVLACILLLAGETRQAAPRIGPVASPSGIPAPVTARELSPAPATASGR